MTFSSHTTVFRQIYPRQPRTDLEIKLLHAPDDKGYLMREKVKKKSSVLENRNSHAIRCISSVTSEDDSLTIRFNVISLSDDFRTKRALKVTMREATMYVGFLVLKTTRLPYYCGIEWVSYRWKDVYRKVRDKCSAQRGRTRQTVL